ncbi:probable Bax inhibitor 1 [Limanda limanda]|uniref:probable Bax inhibitor 1 n=1 Tax=Limanda limanda TaxID=27771 RepID=UPI0029C87489|nr:probable Bax inhibitor 1 [Limanda limanda]
MVTSEGRCGSDGHVDLHSSRKPSDRRRNATEPTEPTGSEASDPPGAKMNAFDRNINFDSLFKFSQISHSTQVHLKNVYSSLAVCMFVAGAGSYVHVVTRLFQGGLLSVLGSLGMMFWLAMTPHNAETEKKRLAILAGFAFLTGLGLGPTMDFVIAINPSIIVTAFLGTSVIFVCFTLSALYAKRRSYLFLGGTLMSGLSLLLLMSIMNMFFGSVMLFKAHMYLGLIIMCGFVLFDTQLIIEKAENGDKDYVWHCVDLFLDFITIFRKLMVILALNEKDKKKEKK